MSAAFRHGQMGVTEVCKEAEIARPTFCYHFEGKYDLMAWMICQTASKRTS